MIDQPASPPLVLPGGDGSPIVLTDLRWPFDQLHATGVPAELPVASPDVQLSLAMLAAMKDGVPSLVAYDEAGRTLATGDRVQGLFIDQPPAGQAVYRQVLTSGTEALELKIGFVDAGLVNATVQVVGHDSSWAYLLPTPITAKAQRLIVQVDTAWDSSLDITVVNGSGVHEIFIRVTLVKAVDEITMLTNAGQEPALAAAYRAGLPGDIVQTAAFDTILGAGATLTLVPANGNQSVYLLDWNVRVISTGAAVIVLEDDTNPTPYARENTSAVGALSHQLGGVITTAGHLVRLRNASGVGSGELLGELAYVQK